MKNSTTSAKGKVKVKDDIITIADERVELTNQPSEYFRIGISGIDLSDTKAIDVNFEALRKAEADLNKAMGKTDEGEDDFPGGTPMPEDKGIMCIKALENCQGDLCKLPGDYKNPIVKKVWNKIENILGQLRAMPSDI